MVIKKEKAFVLTQYPYKETSSIVLLLTKNEGIKRGIAKGLRRKKTKLKDLLSQFSEVEVQFYEGEKGQLVTFTETEIINSIVPYVIESPCPFILSYFAEVILQTVPENLPNEKIYKLVKHIMEGFSKKIPWQCLKVYFDFWIIKLNGIMPSKFLCKCKKEAKYFEEKTGDFLCEEHNKNGIKIKEEFYGFLKIIKGKDIFSIPPYEKNKEIYRFLNKVFNLLILNFLQKELKSYEFLKTCDKLFIV